MYTLNTYRHINIIPSNFKVQSTRTVGHFLENHTQNYRLFSIFFIKLKKIHLIKKFPSTLCPVDKNCWAFPREPHPKLPLKFNFFSFIFHSFSFFSIKCAGPVDKNWRNRRSQKLDKMELLNLQSSLNSEIQAKQLISDELTKVRTDLIAHQKYVFFSYY